MQITLTDSNQLQPLVSMLKAAGFAQITINLGPGPSAPIEAHLPGRAFLTDDSVREIRRLHRDNLTQRELAARFNVSQATISGIVQGRSWKHVSDEVASSLPLPDSQSLGNHKLDESQVREIRRLHSEGCLNYSQIGRRFGVTWKTVRNACQGRSWKNVT